MTKREQWYKKAERGTLGEMVCDILADWTQEIQAVQTLCKIYFTIASNILGEEGVRIKRDKMILKVMEGEGR